MAIKYFEAPDVEQVMKDLVITLGFSHIEVDRVGCVRSRGSMAYRTIARCHGMPKILQLGMKTRPFYVIEVISEQFDKMDFENKIKTIIHELMHIPKNFGGGFRHHDFVTKGNIEKMYKTYLERSAIPNNIVIKNSVDEKPKWMSFF